MSIGLHNIASRPRKMADTMCQATASGRNVATVLGAPIISGLRVPVRTVVVIDSVQHCESQLRGIDPKITFIGLDCEWVSRGKDNRPVALLQVATPHRDCYLIRLNKLPSIPDSLRKILSNERLLKFGVGIMEDRMKLFQRTSVQPVSCVDLRNVAVLCGLTGSLSLATLAKEVTGTELDKNPKVRRGDWEADVLTPTQIQYAAMDALVAIDIISALVNRNLAMNCGEHTDSTVAASKHPTVHWDSPEFTDCLHSMCGRLLDIGYRDMAKRVNQGAPSRVMSTPPADSTSPSTISPRRTKSYSLRRTPLYHNCQLLAPDGQLLSTIDRKKMEWYLQRGLAEVVTEDPPTVMTTFEPAGRPGDERQYYMLEKENRCVVCGRMDGYIRKNVIPHEYRRFFPVQHKEHISHDVLLLCVNCHQLSSQHDAQRRQALAVEYDAPLHLSMPKQKEDSWLVQVKSHSKALLNGKSIPDGRRRELLDTLQKHFGVEEVTAEMIEEGTQVDTRGKSTVERSMSHGHKVVQSVLLQQRLLEFQQDWRQHFLDTMQPHYLPQLWSVSHDPTPLREPSDASWGVVCGFWVCTAVQLFCLYSVLRQIRE